MSDQRGYGPPQQPGRPGGYGYPKPQPGPAAWSPPAPVGISGWSNGKKAGVGCGGALAVLFVLGLIGAATGDGSGGTASPAPTVTVTVTTTVPGPVVTVTAAAQPQAAVEAKPSDTPAPAQPTAEATGALPNFVGKELQASQDGAQASGFYLLGSTDATGAGRMQVLDRNWKVCAQSPAPGTHPLTTKVVFDTVKLEERCP
ncbi:hypothetical protein OG625_36650 [Streptomyces sp. NBC_01351]|uniref:hypothetical protein n=1 Tax=Streptomyces sp. NBC_01351 TaxID=2903833 RepID=UPI002E2F38FE|nr:hypothetical protein [Streptomyces sp. NBC_01351]